MTGAPVRLLVNPVAGRGRALRQLEAARHAMARVGPFDVVETTHAGDEARLATDAVRDGVRTLAVLGGDGTISRVAAALVAAQGTSPARPRADSNTALAVLGAGTGNDFVKSLGVPSGDFADMATRIARRETRAVDMGCMNDRLFVNAAGFGFDVAVLERTTRARWLRGDAVYLAAALAELFQFRGFDARISVAPGSAQHLMVVVANGQWFGGTFRIAPTAALSDGALDLVVIGDVPAWRRARLFAAAPTGGHLGSAGVQHVSTAALSIAFPAPPKFQIDGELMLSDAAHCDVRVLPGALTCVV